MFDPSLYLVAVSRWFHVVVQTAGPEPVWGTHRLIENTTKIFDQISDANTDSVHQTSINLLLSFAILPSEQIRRTLVNGHCLSKH
jgi:hypothetical protein